MIYTFKITSSENPEFIRLIEINPECTFDDFHSIIQQSSDFDSDQLASFFITNESWGKRIEITLLDMGLNGSPRYTMQSTKICELIKEKGQRLLYVFDFFYDRSYYVELTGISMEKNLNEPLIAFAEGNAPAQILTSDVDVMEAPAINLDEPVFDYGELEDYTQIYGEMDDVTGGV